MNNMPSPISSLHIDYKSKSSELCQIGKKYDTDKSSQRNDVTNLKYCHPYTLFYDGLFKGKKDEYLEIAELGILDGGSLLMWKEYFKNSNIYGFEYNVEFINKFKRNFNNERINLSHIDVTNEESIKNAFNNQNLTYDIIIEDTTHQFVDQIRVIKNIHPYLKPGGILIIEDIFKAYNEKDYIDNLKEILEKYFQSYYFVSLDHVNRNSTGWNNDKLFVLIKNGGVPIFQNNNKLTIITPSYRTSNLVKIKNSINFNYVNEWIIVYDGDKILNNPNIFKDENNDKIKEHLFKGDGISGNPQRNYALTQITNENTFLYYLDDDNVIHPDLYILLDVIEENNLYTFNQHNRIKGVECIPGKIDTAMLLIDYKLCKGITWNPPLYDADGHYIQECYKKNSNNHIYVNNDLCYYNRLQNIA